MKVLVISHMYPSTFSDLNGIFVSQQTKALMKEGCNVRVISPIPWSPFPLSIIRPRWRAYSQIPFQTSDHGVDVYYPRYLEFPRQLSFHSAGKRMYSGIKRLVEDIHSTFKFDIIHAHVALPDGSAAIFLKSTYERPLVVTIHGQDLSYTIYKNAKCRQEVKRVFEKADRIVTVSTKLRNVAINEIGCLDKIQVVGNGIDPCKIFSSEARVKPLFAKYRQFRVVLSVSNLIPLKGIDLNLRAIALLCEKYSNLKYLVIGDGPEMDNLKKTAVELKLGEHVEFLGELSNERVLEYMHVAALFSLPSRPEGFGIAYIEAMACGKPVIACRGQGIEDVIRDGETGLLVKPSDVDGLALAMDYLLADPGKAGEIGKNAQRIVLEKYSWQHNAVRMMTLYEETFKSIR